MQFIHALQMKHKLLMMLILPLAGLVWFAQSKISSAYRIDSEMADLLSLSELTVHASTMVHELQKERGMSAGYLGSRGATFARELADQKNLTDETVDAFRSYLGEFDVDAFDAEFRDQLAAGMNQLDGLADIRSRVRTLSVTTSEGVGYYTQANASFLGLVEFLAKHSSVGAISNRGSAYAAFLESKERAGIERAVLANVFAADRFAPGTYDQFRDLVTRQDVYLQTFSSLASAAERDFFANVTQIPAIEETNRMRTIASDRADVGGFSIDPMYWFQMQTEKIDALKSVEDFLASNLSQQAQDVRSQASADLIGALILAFASIGGAAVVGVAILRSVMNQLGEDPSRLQEAINAIANGDLDTDLETDRPARGVYADAQKMQKNLRERIEADQSELRKNTRIRRALDTVDGNIMIVDAELNIIYMNDAANDLMRELAPAFSQGKPGFDASSVMGTNIDEFHKHPEHQRDLLQSLKSSHTSEVSIGDHTWRIVSNPVFGADGERIGTVLEWTDRTLELAVEEEVQRVVDGARAGDLSQRIDLTGKTGFFGTLSEGVNQLVDLAERVIGDTVGVFSSMATGDLTTGIDTQYSGQFDRLKQDANATIAKLTEVVGNIKNAALSVKTAAAEISEGNINLSQRTEEQASSLEETASSMEQMTSTVKQNADNASQANQLAQTARNRAEAGGEIVNRAVAAMGEINESSKRMADIIGVIDEIAFQTNLLALNASVEAARAGEQGRGFAVVASEVRNLAGRSATAAKEIKELIVDSGRKVEEGSSLVNESGVTLEEIVNGVKQVTDIVGEIAAASREQSVGIDEVNKAVMQMDELTQQNAALVEEAAAASASLGDQANELSTMMEFFAVDDRKDVPLQFGTGAVSSAEEPPLQFGSSPVERRSANRPWSKPRAESEPEQPLPPQRFVVAGGDDSDWEEF